MGNSMVKIGNTKKGLLRDVKENFHIQWNLYRSQIIRFPGSVVQFLWSLSEWNFNYIFCIYCLPGSIVSFSDPGRKRWIEVSLYIYKYKKINLHIDEQKRDRNILFSIVFTQDNTNTSSCILNTTHLPASTTPNTDHITSTAHCTH
jgi:hypothetical protein